MRPPLLGVIELTVVCKLETPPPIPNPGGKAPWFPSSYGGRAQPAGHAHRNEPPLRRGWRVAGQHRSR